MRQHLSFREHFRRGNADSRYNVAQLYARLVESIRDGKPMSPGFDAAVTRHRLIDAIVRASETGMKQVA